MTASAKPANLCLNLPMLCTMFPRDRIHTFLVSQWIKRTDYHEVPMQGPHRFTLDLYRNLQIDWSVDVRPTRRESSRGHEVCQFLRKV